MPCQDRPSEWERLEDMCKHKQRHVCLAGGATLASMHVEVLERVMATSMARKEHANAGGVNCGLVSCSSFCPTCSLRAPPPPLRPSPCPNMRQLLVQGAKVRNTGLLCLDKPILARGGARGHMLQTQPNPTPDMTMTQSHEKYFFSRAQLKYQSVACILTDRHRIETLANLAPHLEELDMLAFWGWYMTGSLAVRRELSSYPDICEG